MRRRGLRVALWLLLVVGVAAAGWQYYRLELDSGESLREALLLDGFRDQVHDSVTRARAAQQAYVAPGQELPFWQTRFAEAMADMTGAVENLRVTAEDETAAAAALEAVERAVKVYDGLDRKIRGYVEGGSLIMAADIVYEDAVKTSGLITSGVEEAHALLATPHRAAAEANRRQQRLLAAGAVVFGLLVSLLLVPRGRDAESEAIVESRPEAALPPAAPTGPPSTEPVAATRPAPAAPPAPAPVAVPAGAPAAALPHDGHALDASERASLSAAADVCTDLARVKDGDELRDALGRAARTLDASGVIVWIADASGRALKPLLTYGYPEEALRRIPTLPRDADNATAAAWREGKVQVVEATEAAPGAVAVPILAPQGCTGVLAAEIGHHREASAYTRAVAQIVAAQLAVLIPPESPSD